MKKKVAVILLSAFLLLSGCNSSGKDIVIMADGYEGFVLATEKPVAEPVSIPSETLSVPEEVHTDDTANSTDISVPEETDVTTHEEETTLSYTEEVTVSANTTTMESVTESQTETSTTQDVTTTLETEATTATTVSETTTDEQLPISPQVSSNGYSALNYSEVRGVWISYIELAGVLTGKTQSQFTSSIRQMFQNCADMGLNTVYVHVRSHGDAYYASDYYPWSKYVTGTIGQEPSFDPLEIMIAEAHALGLSFQAWINPYRLCSSSDISNISSEYAIGQWYNSSFGDRIVEVGGFCYLNPGYSEAVELISNGAREIVAKYDVDGIHIDDYFYPTTEASFDKISFESSGFSSLSDYRFENCNKAVKALYNAVKAGNSTALFGVAPQGNVQNNYSYMYADVEKWCSTYGYIDYIAPQVYFGFNNKVQPYEDVLKQWQDMVSGTNVRLIPGLAVYKIGEQDSSYAGSVGKVEWITDKEIIKRQILCAGKMANYGGTILYSYNYVFNPSSSVSQIKAEMDAVRSIYR